MFFKKKKMVDIRDLPQRSSSLPNGKAFVAKDGYGFVDLTKKQKLPSEVAKEKALLGKIKTSVPQEQPTSSFSFFDTPSTPAQSYPQTTSTNNSDMEDSLRKISSQISDLDTKLYKMEQRLEVVERKSGINNSSNSGGFGW